MSAPISECVGFEVKKQVLVVSFNRPEQENALTFDMLNKLHARLKLVTTDRTLRAILICAEGTSFMNGYDEKLMGADYEGWIKTLSQMTPVHHLILRDLLAMDKPIISHIHGKVNGPGLSFALCADIVIASDNVVLTAGMNRQALPPQGAAAYFICQRMGLARTMEFYFCDQPIHAEDAKSWGLVNHIAPHDAAKDMAIQISEKLATGPTRSYAATRMLIRKSMEHDFNTHLGEEHAAWALCSRSFDGREAHKAILQKRPPIFTGA